MKRTVLLDEIATVEGLWDESPEDQVSYIIGRLFRRVESHIQVMMLEGYPEKYRDDDWEYSHEACVEICNTYNKEIRTFLVKEWKLMSKEAREILLYNLGEDVVRGFKEYVEKAIEHMMQASKDLVEVSTDLVNEINRNTNLLIENDDSASSCDRLVRSIITYDITFEELINWAFPTLECGDIEH